MTRTRLSCIVAALAVAAAVAVVVCRTGDDGPENEAAAATKARRSRVPAVHQRSQTGKRPARPQWQQKPVLDFGSASDDESDSRTPAERSLAADIEKALEDENLSLAIACAEKAQSCAVVEIRQAMVDTLGWFGEKALPELTPFLADADEDVRENAKDEWTMALSGIEDDGVRIKTVELAMAVLKDEDALDEISGEYIGVDEKMAVESLARIIAAGASPEGVEKAKETYEFVTGDEWAGEEEAARWIAEEYEPSEGQ